MKSYQNLLNETLQSADIEELESAADLFQYGLEKGYYTRLQQQEFNNNYWSMKNKFITDSITEDIKGVNTIVNIIDLIYMVSKAPATVKEDKQQLIAYINKIIKSLKKSRVA